VRLLALPFALLLLVLVPTSSAQENETFFMLHMQEYSYLPATLEVPAGVEVVAMNFGPANQSLPRDQWGEYFHTVTSSTDRSLFDVQRIPPDGTPHPFRAPATPGTYPYYCVYHGDAQGNGMAGTLVVTEARGAVTPPSGTTPTGATPEADNDAPLPAWALIAGCAVAAAALRRSRR
jgi:plastocyanin